MKKREEKEERQILVNEDNHASEGDGGGERRPEQIGETIRAMTLNGRESGPSPNAKREYLAQQMVNVLKDEHSLGYYRKVAAEIDPARIFEVLSIVKQAAREGRIANSRGAVFTAIISHAEDRRTNLPPDAPE